MKHENPVFYFLAILTLALFFTAGSALAQPPGGGAAGDQAGSGQMQGAPTGQQGGPGGMQMMQRDPEQMQQMMAQRYKELLGMSDEEWAVTGPYVLKVATLSASTQTRGMGMRMMGGRGNMPGGGTGQDQTQSQAQSQSQNQDQRQRGMTRGETDENLQALQTLLEDENATTDEIKTKLSALRKAREASKQELVAAQKQLRELLTLRQEATLVVMGLLE